MDRSEPGEQLLIKEHSESECAAIEIDGRIEIADPDDSTSHGRHYDTPNRMVCTEKRELRYWQPPLTAQGRAASAFPVFDWDRAPNGNSTPRCPRLSSPESRTMR